MSLSSDSALRANAGAFVGYLFFGPSREMDLRSESTDREMLEQVEAVTQHARMELNLVNDGTPPAPDPHGETVCRHFLTSEDGSCQLLHQRMQTYEVFVLQIGLTPGTNEQEVTWTEAQAKFDNFYAPLQELLQPILKARIEVLVGIGPGSETIRRAREVVDLTIRPRAELLCGTLYRDINALKFILAVEPEKVGSAEEFLSIEMLSGGLAYCRGMSAVADFKAWRQPLDLFLDQVEERINRALHLLSTADRPSDLNQILKQAVLDGHRQSMTHRRLLWLRDRIEVARQRMRFAWSMAFLIDRGIATGLEAELAEWAIAVDSRLEQLNAQIDRMGHLFQALALRAQLDAAAQRNAVPSPSPFGTGPEVLAPPHPAE